VREIKYRAWDKENKLMIFELNEPNVFANRNGWELSFGTLPDIGQMKGKCIETILMQYTGLKDKNGNEIYEGDILEIPEYYDGDYKTKAHKAVVEYDNSGFDLFYGGEGLYNGHSGYDNLDTMVGNEPIVVIGNIYENPELLEEKE